MKKQSYIAISFYSSHITCAKLEKYNDIFCILNQETMLLSGSEIVQGKILNNQALHVILAKSNILSQDKQIPIMAIIPDFNLYQDTKQHLLSLQVGLLLAKQKRMVLLIGSSLTHLRDIDYTPPKHTNIWHWLAGSAGCACLIIAGCLLYTQAVHQKTVLAQKINTRQTKKLEIARRELQNLRLQHKMLRTTQKLALLPQTLRELSTYIPDQTYLTDISIEDTTITMHGLSTHAQEIETFNKNLAQSAYIRASQIKHIKQYSADQSLLTFHLISSIKLPA